ncbi:MAG: hypothetical protein LBP20_01235 [Treponema sp.]|jgi:hypothetical protein|nr:hypothetical protein [Treponema sp.]
MNKSPAGTGRDRERPDKTSCPLLLVLLNGAVLLSFLFCLVILILYALAVRREEGDSALFNLIQWAVYGGIVLVILSLYRFFAGVWFCLRRRRLPFLLSSLGFLILGALGAFMAAALTLIRSLAGGNT